MHRETEVALIERALENAGRRKNDGEGAPYELSVDRYLDPEILERERALLRDGPVVVGFASEVARAGDFITHDHAGVPILVTRDRAGRLRAFLNACRHRGTRLEAAACGHVERAFSCPYHGWTYGLGGRLEGVPHNKEFAGIDLAGRSLVELSAAERFGLVFVRPTPGPPLDLEGTFAPFCEDLDGFGFKEHVLFAPSVRTHRMNWKLMMDGSFETYHFRVTHAATIAPMFFDNVGVFDWREPNVRMVLPKRSILELRDLPEAEWSIRPHANILYGLFPNTIILVQPDHAMVLTIWPAAPDTSVIAAGMLIPKAPASERAEAHWQKNLQIFWDAILEDIRMAEQIQSTLASGANRTLLFGRSEHLIGKFHRAVEARCGQG